MFYTISAIFIRIFSNSYLNVFQKILTNKGQPSSVVNFYTYFGLTLFGIFFLKSFHVNLFPLVLLMGFIGTLGNYFIIKALSIGELSTLAPINSYKPIVALIFGFIFLNEVPSLNALFGILLIILGTYFIIYAKGKINKLAIFYRVLALTFSGSEAIIIKKIVMEVGLNDGFVLWSIGGLIFSFIFLLISRHKPIIQDYKYQLFLILAVAVMQYSTSFVFLKMNVSYALALFQLSTLLSVILGANIFNEKNIKRKLIGSLIMIIGAVFIILN